MYTVGPFWAVDWADGAGMDAVSIRLNHDPRPVAVTSAAPGNFVSAFNEPPFAPRSAR